LDCFFSLLIFFLVSSVLDDLLLEKIDGIFFSGIWVVVVVAGVLTKISTVVLSVVFSAFFVAAINLGFFL